MDQDICIAKNTLPPRRQAWGQSLQKAVVSPPASWCEVTIHRVEPGEALLKKFGLERDRAAWVGHESSQAKLEAIEEFEKRGASFGIGLTSRKNFFWLIRGAGSLVRKVADTESSAMLSGCKLWPVGVGTNGGKLALEFVSAGEDSVWQIFRFWNKLLFTWGIKDYQFEVHAGHRAWEQLDVNQAFVHFDSRAIQDIRKNGFPGGNKYHPWDSKVCLVRDGVLSGCVAGRNGNFIP